MNAFNGYYTRKNIDEEGNIELVFTLKNFADIEIAKELEKGKLYRFKTSEVKSHRTIAQNRMLWQIMEEIAEADNGERYSSEDVWNVYLEALERANAKFEYIQIVREGIPLLKANFRVIKEMQSFTNEKGNEIVTLKVFYGSSQLDVKEMAKLIDTVLDMATERGITLKAYD